MVPVFQPKLKWYTATQSPTTSTSLRTTKLRPCRPTPRTAPNSIDRWSTSMKNFWVVLLPLKILPGWISAWAQPSRHQRLRRLLSPCPSSCPQTTVNKIRAPMISLSRPWDSPVPSLIRPKLLAPKIRQTRLSSRPTAPIASTILTLEMFSDLLPLGMIPLRFLRSGHLLKKNEQCFPNKLLRKMFYMTSYWTESEIEADWWSASKICRKEEILFYFEWSKWLQLFALNQSQSEEL